MRDLVKLRLDEFLAYLASDEPVPGGGSVAALGGALAAALTAMVTRLTLGRKKFQDRWAHLEPILVESDQQLSAFQSLVSQDTDAYRAVIDAYRLPAQSSEEKRAKKEAIQKAIKEAARVPMETLTRLERLAMSTETALCLGNPNAMSDAGAAMEMIGASARIAAYNVWINVSIIDDPSFAETMQNDVTRSLARIDEILGSCRRHIEGKLR